jgi:hypothetical protein
MGKGKSFTGISRMTRKIEAILVQPQTFRGPNLKRRRRFPMKSTHYQKMTRSE